MHQPTETAALFAEYIATLAEVELQAMEIAKSHLKTSFSLEKSIGFVAFLADKKKKAAAPR